MTKRNEKRKRVCLWTPEDNEYDNGTWNTSCGQAFTLIDGTPKYNDFKFCTFCGKKIIDEKD